MKTAIETKFSIGDRIFVIHRTGVYKNDPCRTCGETGEVTIGGDTFVCPRCKGMKLEQRSVQRWLVTDSGTIDRVEVMLLGSSSPAWMEEGKHYVEKYMFNTTCGSVFQADNCFASREEAEAECNRRNSEDTP